MPNLVDRIPSYRHHKASGQAVVSLSGRDHYLGAHGSPASKREYNRLIAEWLANDRQLVPQNDLTITELLAAYWRHVKKHYVKNGKPTAEQRCIKSAVRTLRELYGDTAACKFGPLALKAVRERMIGYGWTRKFVNKSVCRVRHLFRWAVGDELLPVSVYQALQTVQGLQAGRTAARETKPRHAVPQHEIDKVRSVVRQRTRDLIDLGLLTGARPGELLALTTGMINRSGDVWVARFENHKTMHFGKDRRLFFGPRAQLILNRYLSPWEPDRRLFAIDVDSLRCTVSRACKRAGVTRWTPHWLRHSCASHVRSEFGAEAAQAILGHSHLSTTEIYAEKSQRLAMEVAQKVG